ncbi:MAG: ABC transporter ATP-binding protein, partial [Nitrospinae bacterium]|nr:ABC transporter ATP-binding protein [Nitrospinota bacterium]
SGELHFNGEKTSGMSAAKQSEIRNKKIGFVFQFHYLLPEFTALENVIMPAIIGGKNKNKALKEAEELLERVGLKERIHHKPPELSGGEQQRVAISRAMMNKPSIIFADEPTGNLDSENSERIHQIILTMNKEYNVSFLIVTHNEAMMNITHRNLTIVDGSVKR